MSSSTTDAYLDNAGRTDRFAGGVRRISIDTPRGPFKVWTRRFGNNPRIKLLLLQHHYIYHVLRAPLADWPDPVDRLFKHLNPKVYIPMQGPSELGASGKLAQWDRTADLPRIRVPALAIGAQHDTMDPHHMQNMARAFTHGRYLFCPEGSHLAMFDDQQCYFDGLIRFLRDVDGQAA